MSSISYVWKQTFTCKYNQLCPKMFLAKKAITDIYKSHCGDFAKKSVRECVFKIDPLKMRDSSMILIKIILSVNYE